MKCFVCGKTVTAKESYKQVFLGHTFKYICSPSCYKIYCIEYTLTELNTGITEMEKRLKNYKKKGGKNQK